MPVTPQSVRFPRDEEAHGQCWADRPFGDSGCWRTATRPCGLCDECFDRIMGRAQT